MKVRGLAKVAAAAAVMTMLPLNAAAQTVRASQSLPSTTVAVAEDARAGAALQSESEQTGFPWLIVFVVLAIGAGIYFAVNDSGDGPRSPNT